MPTGFRLLIGAQFTSALADNALLIVTIALLQALGEAAWWAPMLKFGSTLAYVLLAPFLGPLADAVPKARLMAWMNALKTIGVIGLISGGHPVAAFVVVGLGAAAYAPAKYGLITELVPARRLVAANGWVEVSVVGAALLGTVLGGALVSDRWRTSPAAQTLGDVLGTLLDASGVRPPGPAAESLGGALLALLLLYALAGVLNLGIPDSGARYASRGVHPARLCADFRLANRTLWRDPDGGLSLAATTLFWGVGATLQFAVLRWGADVLHLSLDRAAYLQAAVAVGVVGGATMAGRWVPLHRSRRVLPAGIVLGVLIAGVALLDRIETALPVLVVVGAVGGVLVVPLNALLQHRGHELLSAGRSIAVQGFNENASVLTMLGTYAALMAFDVPIVPLMVGFGVLIAALMGVLVVRERRRAWRAAVSAPVLSPPVA